MSKTTVTLDTEDVEQVKVTTAKVIAEAVLDEWNQAAEPALTPNPSPNAEGGGSRTEGQLAMALCATCAHSQSPDHPGDGPCQVSWFNEDKVQRFCRCAEFWPYRPQREDGYVVMAHEIALGGSVEVLLDRRQPTELWDSLGSGRFVTLTLSLRVAGKGYKAVLEKGAMVGVAEYRKLKAERVVWSYEARELDEETGELLWADFRAENERLREGCEKALAWHTIPGSGFEDYLIEDLKRALGGEA